MARSSLPLVALISKILQSFWEVRCGTQVCPITWHDVIANFHNTSTDLLHADAAHDSDRFDLPLLQTDLFEAHLLELKFQLLGNASHFPLRLCPHGLNRDHNPTSRLEYASEFL